MVRAAPLRLMACPDAPFRRLVPDDLAAFSISAILFQCPDLRTQTHKRPGESWGHPTRSFRVAACLRQCPKGTQPHAALDDDGRPVTRLRENSDSSLHAQGLHRSENQKHSVQPCGACPTTPVVRGLDCSLSSTTMNVRSEHIDGRFGELHAGATGFLRSSRVLASGARA